MENWKRKVLKHIHKLNLLPKRERFEIVKPNSSNIWKEQQKQDESAMEMEKYSSGMNTENLKVVPERIVNNLTENNKACTTAYTETFMKEYQRKMFDALLCTKIKKSNFPRVDHLENQNFYHISSGKIPVKRVQMASTKLRESMLWQNDQIKTESQYNTDFVPKLNRCPAGELIESIAKNHSSTEHFEFYRILGGHHFYEPKADNMEKIKLDGT
ncbi:hypothetical protein DINM_000942 [Dirofilaria immitis]|nr:hypothetical protein [Dirofilaria immitis]